MSDRKITFLSGNSWEKETLTSCTNHSVFPSNAAGSQYYRAITRGNKPLQVGPQPDDSVVAKY